MSFAPTFLRLSTFNAITAINFLFSSENRSCFVSLWQVVVLLKQQPAREAVSQLRELGAREWSVVILVVQELVDRNNHVRYVSVRVLDCDDSICRVPFVAKSASQTPATRKTSARTKARDAIRWS